MRICKTTEFSISDCVKAERTHEAGAPVAHPATISRQAADSKSAARPTSLAALGVDDIPVWAIALNVAIFWTCRVARCRRRHSEASIQGIAAIQTRRNSPQDRRSTRYPHGTTEASI